MGTQEIWKKFYLFLSENKINSSDFQFLLKVQFQAFFVQDSLTFKQNPNFGEVIKEKLKVLNLFAPLGKNMEEFPYFRYFNGKNLWTH